MEQRSWRACQRLDASQGDVMGVCICLETPKLYSNSRENRWNSWNTSQLEYAKNVQIFSWYLQLFIPFEGVWPVVVAKPSFTEVCTLTLTGNLEILYLWGLKGSKISHRQIKNGWGCLSVNQPGCSRNDTGTDNQPFGHLWTQCCLPWQFQSKCQRLSENASCIRSQDLWSFLEAQEPQGTRQSTMKDATA